MTTAPTAQLTTTDMSCECVFMPMPVYIGDGGTMQSGGDVSGSVCLSVIL